MILKNAFVISEEDLKNGNLQLDIHRHNSELSNAQESWRDRDRIWKEYEKTKNQSQ